MTSNRKGNGRHAHHPGRNVQGAQPEQKKAIAKELVDGFIRGAGGGSPSSFNVVFVDVEKHDWAVGHDMMSEKYPDK